MNKACWVIKKTPKTNQQQTQNYNQPKPASTTEKPKPKSTHAQMPHTCKIFEDKL